MIKYFLFIFVSLFFFNQILAKDVSIKKNINLIFFCNLEKKIIKNSINNNRTYLDKELNS